MIWVACVLFLLYVLLWCLKITFTDKMKVLSDQFVRFLKTQKEMADCMVSQTNHNDYVASILANHSDEIRLLKMKIEELEKK